MKRVHVLFLVSFVSIVGTQRWARAQDLDEVTRLLQQYVAIDTSNPQATRARPRIS